MANRRFYGVTYPFTCQNEENYFIDLNYNIKDKVKSMIMHVIFTPKGQKIRDPEFGTDLIKFIFEPDDSISWEGIKSEVSDAVSKYISNVKLNNISILKDDNEMTAIFVRIDYSINDGINIINDSIVTKV